MAKDLLKIKEDDENEQQRYIRELKNVLRDDVFFEGRTDLEVTRGTSILDNTADIVGRVRMVKTFGFSSIEKDEIAVIKEMPKLGSWEFKEAIRAKAIIVEKGGIKEDSLYVLRKLRIPGIILDKIGICGPLNDGNILVIDQEVGIVYALNERDALAQLAEHFSTSMPKLRRLAEELKLPLDDPK